VVKIPSHRFRNAPRKSKCSLGFEVVYGACKGDAGQFSCLWFAFVSCLTTEYRPEGLCDV